MKPKSFLKISFLSLLLSVFLIQFISFPAHAASDADNARCTAFKNQFVISGENVIDGNPVFCSATDVILVVINYLLVMSGTVTALFIIFGGFLYLTSAGNDEQAEKGKKTLSNALIGLVIITLAFTIVRIVSGTLSSSAR